jgi:predicted dehydrogenase
VLDAIHDMTSEFVLYFASRDESKAREYCESYAGAGYFGSYEDAAADPRVEAMYSFTPHDMHLDSARLAARHSKHILVEKPIARTLDEAREMVQVADSSGIKLMVAENYRFAPAVTRIKELIGEGGLGELRLVRIHVEEYRRKLGWMTSLERSGGGVFLSGGIHAVDILANIAGSPETVCALVPPKVHPTMEGEDALVMMARFPGGAVGMISYTAGTAARTWNQKVTVTCTRGDLSFQDAGPELTIATPEGVSSEEVGAGWNAAVRGMLREFRDCIVEDREPAMSGREGMRDLAIVLAAYKSVATGSGVRPEFL